MLNIQKKLSNSFYAILSMPATAMGFALCVQISALSWILSTKYNLEIDKVGYVWLAGPLAGIFGQLIVGKISDGVWFWGGRRRPFIMIGGTLAALMLLCLPNIDNIAVALGINNLLPVALVIALLLDLSINISFNPTRSIISDLTPEGKERTKGYTWMQTVSGTLGVIAYFIGAYINNYVLIYTGVFVVLFFSIVPLFFIEEPVIMQPVSPKEQKKYSFKTILQVLEPFLGYMLILVYTIAKLFFTVSARAETFIMWMLIVVNVYSLSKPFFSKDKRKDEALNLIPFKRILVAHSFTWLGVQTIFVFMYAYAMQTFFHTLDAKTLTEEEKDFVGSIPAYSFLVMNAVGALFPSLVLAPLAKKIGRIQAHILSLLCMGIGYVLIVLFAKQPIFIYACMAICGIGWGAVVSLPFAIMSEQVDKSKMGLFMGIFNMSIVVPQLMVSLIIGKLVNDAADKTIIFEISAVSLFLSAFLWRWIKERSSNDLIKKEAVMH